MAKKDKDKEESEISGFRQDLRNVTIQTQFWEMDSDRQKEKETGKTRKM